ncbi:Pro-resilin-like 27 [Homarus americanus]|uniref:Pro-resilin-like 27 n=1 Tax=Homarus americanus TaxID=6706 RepID=A0A8J5K185_HOMAM|nr:Pro-resilin-like 27 [Homarus americanus]
MTAKAPSGECVVARLVMLLIATDTLVNNVDWGYSTKYYPSMEQVMIEEELKNLSLIEVGRHTAKYITVSSRQMGSQFPRDNTTSNMNTKILILLGVAALAAADSRSRETFSYQAPRAYSDESFESTEAKYNYQWAVSDDPSRNEFNHQEARENDNAEGSYYVHLPDGRVQRVTYRVDGDSGYVAEVNYEGEAQFPESDESREYAPPRRSYFDSNESK